MCVKLPSLIEDDTVCKAALVVGTLGVWFLTAAADTWVDDDDDGADDDNDIEVEEDDVEVTDRCTDELGGAGLLAGVFPLGPSDKRMKKKIEFMYV